jgi:hypothetical protein
VAGLEGLTTETTGKDSALLTALTTEHFVLQTAANSTISESAARSSLYLLSLSSSLVAMGFISQSREMFMPFLAAVLPVVFVLGVFSVMRLVDTTLENMQYLAGIARIRSYYRTLGPEAASYFAADSGRWPEVTVPPSLVHGPVIAFLGTSGSMVAFINNVVAGAGVTLLTNSILGGSHIGLALSCGAVTVVILTMAFVGYQRWRASGIYLAMQPAGAEKQGTTDDERR